MKPFEPGDLAFGRWYTSPAGVWQFRLGSPLNNHTLTQVTPKQTALVLAVEENEILVLANERVGWARAGDLVRVGL